MSHAYAVTNQLTAYGATVTQAGGTLSNHLYLRDSRLDLQATGTAGSSPVSLVVDMGTTVALAGFAMLNHNLGSMPAASVTVQSADDSGFTTNLATNKASTSLVLTAPKAKEHALIFPAATPRRYWRLLCEWTGGGNWTPAIGELFAVTSTTSLTRTAIYGSSEHEELITVESKMQYGEVRSAFYGGPIRQKRLRFADLSTTTLAELRALWGATIGPVTPFLWIDAVNSTASAGAAADQECLFARQLVGQFDAVQDDYGVYQPAELLLRQLGRQAGA